MQAVVSLPQGEAGHSQQAFEHSVKRQGLERLLFVRSLLLWPEYVSIPASTACPTPSENSYKALREPFPAVPPLSPQDRATPPAGNGEGARRGRIGLSPSL